MKINKAFREQFIIASFYFENNRNKNGYKQFLKKLNE